MNPRTLRRLDLLSASLLLLWAGMALGFGALVAPTLFRLLPDRETAATVAGALVARLDGMAFLAFGLSFLLSYGSRWLGEIQDPEPVGPLRMWSATATVALLLTALSAFILTPRIRELRAAHGGNLSTLPEEHLDLAALRRNHGLSTQVFALRLLLALGLAWGATRLPDQKAPEEG